jgi:DNA repair exonuclease SbcCD nuclease subunit
MKKTRIAVLSDQHIDCESEPASWSLAQRAFKAAVKSKADHVVLAGDTFDCATAMVRDHERVEKYLRKLGLWQPDRLSVIVGNHDIFHTPHRGSWGHRLAEASKVALVAGQGNYETFCGWAGDVVWKEDLLSEEEDLFPYVKDLGAVQLLVTDTTARTTLHSANGFWSKRDDDLLRAVPRSKNQVRVLAFHNAPFESEIQTITGPLRGEYNCGFPPQEFRRLTRFADAASIDAILCGHVHAMDEDEPWSWKVGRRSTSYLMGRTGGVHEMDPVIGILDVQASGETSWKEIAL